MSCQIVIAGMRLRDCKEGGQRRIKFSSYPAAARLPCFLYQLCSHYYGSRELTALASFMSDMVVLCSLSLFEFEAEE